MGEQGAGSEADFDEEVLSIGIDTSGIVGAGESDRAQLLAGKISREEFFERTVERATAHLENVVGQERLERVRSLLRRQLEEDPSLVSLVQRATSA